MTVAAAQFLYHCPLLSVIYYNSLMSM